MALTVQTLEIPADQALSDGLPCFGKLVRIGMPDAWDAAPLTFQVCPSPDGVDYFDLYHTQITTGSFQPYEAIVPSVIPDTGLSIGRIKFRSGTRQAPITQTAVRTFTILFESNI